MLDAILGDLVHQVLVVKMNRKVAVHTLVAANQLIGEGQSRHQTALLHPKNGAKRTAKEDAFHGCKGYETLRKRGRLNPTQGPVGLLFYSLKIVNCIEELVALGRILHVGINQQGVGLAVNVLHHNLESVEEFCLGILNLIDEVFGQILVHNAVRSGKKRKNMLDEVALFFGQLVFPIAGVLMQVNFFCRPKASLCFFVDIPNVVVLNGEEHEAVGVLPEYRLVSVGSIAHCLFYIFVSYCLSTCWFVTSSEPSVGSFLRDYKSCKLSPRGQDIDLNITP